MLVSIFSNNYLYYYSKSFSSFFNINKINKHYFINFFLIIILKNNYKNLNILETSFIFYKNIWFQNTEITDKNVNKVKNKFLNNQTYLLNMFNFNNYFIFNNTTFFNKNYKNFMLKSLSHNYKFFLFSYNFLIIKSKFNFFAHFSFLLNISNFNFNFYTISFLNFKKLNLFNSLRFEKNLNLLKFNSYLI